MHEKHPKSSDTMETRPVTPHFHFDFSPRIQLSCSIGSFMKIICGNQIVMFPFNESQGTYLAHFSKFCILTAVLDAIFNTGAILCFAEVANTGFYVTN